MMALGVWKRLRTSVASKNPWWTYMLDHFELPSGTRGEYHYVHTNGSSMVIPVLPDGQLLLVNQYRYLASKESLEFPCGSVKDDSTYDRTAWEELAEETGYSAGALLLAGEFNPYNGVTDEMCRVYIARDLSFVGEMPEETEEFELLKLTPEELEVRIRSGELWDGMTIAAWGIARQRIGSKT